MNNKRRKFVTIPQAWKQVFRDIMTSKSPIAIPMSRGLFRPEIHRAAPNPCLLSESDLITVFLFHRWFDVGLKFADLDGMSPVAPGALKLSGIGIVGSHGVVHGVHGKYDQVFGLTTGTATLWFDCRGLQEKQIAKLFPPRGRVAFGRDRVIQRYIEAWDYQVTCIVRPVLRQRARCHHVFFIPLPTAATDWHWEETSLRWPATGEGLYVNPAMAAAEYQYYELGHFEIGIHLVRLRVEAALRALRE